MKCDPNFDDSLCEVGKPPNRHCRMCGGTGIVTHVKFLGRWRTRVEVVKRFLASPEWTGAALSKNAAGDVTLTKGTATVTFYEVLKPTETTK